jgi:predicted nucleic acid-binding protein
MLVVDAGALFEVVASTPRAPSIRELLSADPDHAAPHLIDAEVMSVIQRAHRQGALDATAAGQAVEDLRSWPGERWPLAVFADRVWELRDTVRSYDAYYVALAEALGATLVTCDHRLARSVGPVCPIVTVG